MSSRHFTLLENDITAFKTETITSGSTLPNAFSHIMGPAPTGQSIQKRDRYIRLKP